MKTKNNVLRAIVAIFVVAVVGTAVYLGNTQTQKGSFFSLFAPRPNLIFQKSSDSPFGHVNAGSTDVVLGKWDLESIADVEIRQVDYSILRSAPVDLAGTFSLRLNGQPIYFVAGAAAKYGSSSPYAPSQVTPPVTLATFPRLAEGKPYKLEAVASIPSYAQDGSTYQVNLTIAQVAKSGAPLTFSSATFNPGVAWVKANILTIWNTSMAASPVPMTISQPKSTCQYGSPGCNGPTPIIASAPSLSVSQDYSVSSGNSIVEGRHRLLGSFIISAGATEGVNITSIGVDIAGSISKSQLKKITNVTLEHTKYVGSGSTVGIGNEQLGTTQNIFANVNNYSGVNNYSYSGRQTFGISNYTLRAAELDTIRVYADIDFSLWGVTIEPFIPTNEVNGVGTVSGLPTKAPANRVSLGTKQIVPAPMAIP